MIDEFERLVPLAHGEDASPDFEEALRQKVIERAAAKEVGLETAAPFDIEILADPEKLVQQSPRWALMAVAAAAVLIAGFVLFHGFDDDEKVDTFDPVESTTTTAQPIENVTTTAERPVKTVSGNDPLLTEMNAFIEAGTYRVDTLGTEFTFAVDEVTGVLTNENGRVILAALTSTGAADRTIAFQRLSELSDPTEPEVPFADSDGWPATDVIGWLDNLSADVAATDPVRTKLGGLDAVQFDLELGGVNCPAIRDDCVGFGTNNLLNDMILEKGSSYRVWVVDQQDEDPLAVVVGIDHKSKLEWFDAADRILLSLEFGAIETNPVRRINGTTELGLLGGVRIDLPDEQVLIEPFDGFGRIGVSGLPADVEFLNNPLTLAGSPFETADEVIDALRQGGIQATELEAIVVDGVVAQTFELATGRFPRPSIKRRLEEVGQDLSGWTPSEGGHFWLIEHPERGLLMVSAEAFADQPETIPALRTWAEDLLGTLEFTERD